MARIAETEGQRRTTLFLCAVLHAFTHLYPTVLPPLYYQIARDLELSGVWLATLLVSAQSLAYCLAGLPLGLLADRVSRKWLMFWGLAINGAAFVALGLAPSYT
ncbi:MAG TPA: MFS transporter, partial [Armatimonadetes bacterium]|nr:MFS transporter [Armatimonadota bacterium]